MARTNFDGYIAAGEPCLVENAPVVVYGIALDESYRTDVVQLAMNFGNDVRLNLDVSRIAQLMEEGLSGRALAGPILAMWATQECVAHDDENPRQENLGSWFLPMADVVDAKKIPVSPEDNNWIEPWEAVAYETNRNGGTSSAFTPLAGIALPHPNRDGLLITEAMVLARIDGQDVLGFLHHPDDGTTEYIEHIIPPASPGQACRPRVGKLITLPERLA